MAKRRRNQEAAALFQERRESTKDSLSYLNDDWFASEATANLHATPEPGGQFVKEVTRRPITERVLSLPACGSLCE